MPATLERSIVAWPRRDSGAQWPAVDRRRRRRPAALPLHHYWEIEPEGNRSAFYLIAKRILDVVGAVVMLVVFSPLLAAIYCILWVTTGGKPFFCQERLGYCGRRFILYKFRTMVQDAERQLLRVQNEQTGPVFKNSRDPRVTRIGRVLRRTSLDEFPQLFNVLIGDMSLVGPRPPLEAEVRRYSPWQWRRMSVKPGLTCLWQVSGRCEIEFLEWVRMDLWYVDHQDLLVDLYLLAKTPVSVLSCRGAY
jgi:lipopolysaccharide/colanic/teichoic acid biosynthesis glycosyltransferase